jgi:hypothetical protein
MRSNYRKHTKVGHGGISCPCCAPKSGNKYGARARVIMKRQAKRAESVFIERYFREAG